MNKSQMSPRSPFPPLVWSLRSLFACICWWWAYIGAISLWLLLGILKVNCIRRFMPTTNKCMQKGTSRLHSKQSKIREIWRGVGVCTFTLVSAAFIRVHPAAHYIPHQIRRPLSPRGPANPSREARPIYNCAWADTAGGGDGYNFKQHRKLADLERRQQIFGI